MTEQILPTPTRGSRRSRRLAAVSLAATIGLVGSAGIAGASNGFSFGSKSKGGATMDCPDGMARLSQVFDEQASVFPGDPAPEIDVVFTVGADGFLVEQVKTGTHTGTHLDAPGHFIEGGTTVDDLRADQLVWPSYVIDVRARVAESGGDFQITWNDIREHERRNGRIPAGAMVILFTGFQDAFGTPAYLDAAPGFDGAAVDALFTERKVKGIGSDTFGPDASSDTDYSATYTALSRNGVVLTNLANLEALDTSGDVVMAPAVRLRDGSGYQVDVLACLGKGRR